MKIRKGLLLILAIILAGSARMQAIDYTSMLLPSLTSDDPESIEKFIRDFSRLSDIIRKDVVVNEEFNAIFARHFTETYQERRSTSSPLVLQTEYELLPLYVTAIKYDCNICPILRDGNGKEFPTDIENIVRNIEPVSVIFFTPVIDIDKKVLYLTPNAERSLTYFIMSDDREKKQKRIKMLQKYIPVAPVPMSDCLNFLSLPLIPVIITGNDGYWFESSTTWCGEYFFVPWGGDPIKIGEWIS